MNCFFKISFFYWLFFSSAINLIAQSKHALLIGVGDYPIESGWQNLNALNDIDLLEKVLLQQGFSSNNIIRLSNKEATKATILQYLTDKFPKTLKAGDIAMVHFSGHGQQIADNNQDEIDGYDEAIVPYDSPLKYEMGVYEGANLIRDEELGNALLVIREKLTSGGQLLVTIDACHSGTGTRDVGIRRGTNQKMAAPNYVQEHANRPIEANSLAQEMAIISENISPMVTFFSTSAGELSYEHKDENDKGFGLLSYVLAKQLVRSSQISYRTLLDNIRLDLNRMGALQTPQAEGNLDQQFLKGQSFRQTTFFKIKEVFDKQNVLVNAGQLHGLYKGTIINFYPPDTREIAMAKPIATGKVTYATLLDADITLSETNIAPAVLKNAWGFIKTSNYQRPRVKVQIVMKDSLLKTQLLQKLKEVSTIQLVEKNPTLQLITKANQVQLININNKVIYEENKTTNTLKKLIQELTQYANTNYLRQLEVADNYIALTVTLINAEKGEASNEFRIGEKMKIKIENKGKKGVYYQLLDIQPDNKTAILVPVQGYEPTDYFIEPGEIQTIPTAFEIYPPKGNELFKVIATNQVLDLNWIIHPQNGLKTADTNPYANLLQLKNGLNLKGEQARISIISKSFRIY